MWYWFYFLVVGLIAYFVGRESIKPALHTAEKQLGDTKSQLGQIKELYEFLLNVMRKDSVLLPSLCRWADELQKVSDGGLESYLRMKKRPALKAAEQVQLANRERRQALNELNLVLNRIDLYESLAPWLNQYTDITVHDLLESIRADEKQKELQDNDEDPVSLYVPKNEWQKLTETERNQLAHDRFCNPSRKRSPWAAGIEYERYIGYSYEKEGYLVEYHGAIKGKEDLGIDLICTKEKSILVVQCKRLSVAKQLPVRENVVAQVYGVSRYYQMQLNKDVSVTPVIATTYQLSDEAKQFAKYLGVEIREQQDLKIYPMIKCNISKGEGEKIYHLPIDQQYDRVIVGDEIGEFYAMTVAEAEQAGFRRAYRWKGNAVE